MARDTGGDRVVVGGGLAGMVAANRLAEQGGRVLVLERGADDGGMGNARISGGLFHVGWNPIGADPSELERSLIDRTSGLIDRELLGAYAGNAGRAMDWLTSQGVEIGAKSPAPYAQHTFAPVEHDNVGWRFMPERGSNQAMRRLYAAARERGVDIVLGAEVRAIERGDGRWDVVYRADGREQRVGASGVLVADGGFAANREMLSRYVGPNAADCLRRCTPASTGRGLKMLMELGAAVTGLGRVYGHVVSASAVDIEELWPHPTLDKLCLTGLLVDRDGRRFPSAAVDGVQLVNHLARTEDPRGFAVIADADMWSESGADSPYGAPTPNPTIADRGGEVHEARSVRELAGLLDRPEARLRQALEEHNADPTTRSIGEPLVALPILPGITITMGGVVTDARARVLDEAGNHIPGLWAAGGAAGGLHGGPRGGYVGGLAVALTFGLLAGESMAAPDEPGE